MTAGELLSRVFWRGLPVAALAWAVQAGAIDVKSYLRSTANAFEGFEAEKQLSSLLGLLLTEYRAERRVPAQHELAAFCRKHLRGFGESPELDPWASPLRIESLADGFRLRSAGADRKASTPDDHTQEVTRLSAVRTFE